MASIKFIQFFNHFNATNIKEYDTLPTYIRNCIDHPDNNIVYISCGSGRKYKQCCGK